MTAGPLVATLRLEVDREEILPIGPGPDGYRGVAFIVGGSLAGERLNAEVLGGEDWFVRRNDGSIAIDVRLTLSSDDDAFLTLAYTGALTGTPDALAAFSAGKPMRKGEYRIDVSGRFGCGDERYAWIDGKALVGVGEETAAGPVYRFHAAEGAR
jgi:hypothetical protein